MQKNPKNVTNQILDGNYFLPQTAFERLILGLCRFLFCQNTFAKYDDSQSCKVESSMSSDIIVQLTNISQMKLKSSPESVFYLSVVISLHHNPDDHVQHDESDDAGDDELDDGDEDEEGQ